LGYHDDDPYDWETSIEQDETDSLAKIEQKRISSHDDERKLSRSPTPNPIERRTYISISPRFSFICIVGHPVDVNSQLKCLKNNSPTGLLRKRTDSNHNLPLQQSPLVTDNRQRSPFSFDRIKLDSIGTGDQQQLLHGKVSSQLENRSPDTLTRRSTHLNMIDHGQATSNGLVTYISQQFSHAAAPGAPSVFSQWSPHNGETFADDDILKGNKSNSSRADERATTLSGERTSPTNIRLNHPSSSIKNNSAGQTSYDPTVNNNRKSEQHSIEQNIQVPFGTYTRTNRRQTPAAFSLQRFSRKKSNCS
jgi:hypothetical protein